jgi:hypothetical protein
LHFEELQKAGTDLTSWSKHAVRLVRMSSCDTKRFYWVVTAWRLQLHKEVSLDMEEDRNSQVGD